MRIADLIPARPGFVSLEFFPPRDPASWPGFFATVERLKEANPLFVSVTYGAGGSTQANTLEIVRRMQNGHGLTTMAHLTCVGASREKIRSFMDELSAMGVDNVFALRGDPPRGAADWCPDSADFRHGSDLVAFIRQVYPQVSICVAAYPEGHPANPSIRNDLEMFAQKVRQGADLAITQLFFDNRLYFDFVERLRHMGITVPIVPGVLPIMSMSSLKRLLGFSGASVPGPFLLDLEKAEAEGGDGAVYEVGMAWARRQIRELIAGGAPGVHLYTLNRAEACLDIVRSL